MLVCTPGALTSYDVKRLLRSTRLVVVDEADLLLSGSFGRPMSKVLENLKSTYHIKSLCISFVGSTLRSLLFTACYNRRPERIRQAVCVRRCNDSYDRPEEHPLLVPKEEQRPVRQDPLRLNRWCAFQFCLVL